MQKSWDGGKTWEPLTATQDNSLNSVSPFDIIGRIAVHPITGDIYVATMMGIHRSQDGGISFEKVLSAGDDIYTEITIAPSGKLYASLGISFDTFIDSSNLGIYTSDNGSDWTNISYEEDIFAADIINRSIIAVNPHDENELYVLAAFGVSALFYRYNANTDPKWTELTDNIPFRNGLVGGMNSQLGYNLVLKIHPKDPDFIVFGATNLFRTTDGFATDVEETPHSWIGGYSPKNDVSLYPDQHPDQHEFIFYPSDPDRALSANDGGLFRTEDIRRMGTQEEPVDWISLNNGYLSTQPYAVAINPDTESEELLAGFQDNGTWYTGSSATTAPWEEELAGDGTYCAFADKGRTRYASSQFGNIIRTNYTEDGQFESYARIKPIDGKFEFVAPFTLDPNDDNVMYLPAGLSLMRNSNMDEIPTFKDLRKPNLPSNLNWSVIATVASIPSPLYQEETNTISAVGVSKYPEANKVYFGTRQGQLFRLDLAHLSSSERVDIFTNKGLPQGAFVNSIEVDPNNSNRVIVTFSNYNVKSIFLTEDAGQTWTDISGNLEENRDGTGNGPSVRWTTFLGNGDGLLAATSTGIYYTNRILGEHTVWHPENRQVGEVLTVQIRTREDGFTALAVHGNGVFTRKFDVTPPNTDVQAPFVNKKPNNLSFTLGRVPKQIKLDLSNVFKLHSGDGPIQISAKSTTPDFVSTQVIGDSSLLLTFKEADLSLPLYDREQETTITLIAESKGYRAATEFDINTRQDPLFDQVGDLEHFRVNPERVLTSLEVRKPNTVSGKIFSEIADDIIVPEGEKWRIDRIRGLLSSVITLDERDDDMAILRVYEDKGDMPGKLLVESTDSLRKNPTGSVSSFYFDHLLSNPIELTSGKYWIAWVKVNEKSIFNSYALLSTEIPLGHPEHSKAGADTHFRQDNVHQFGNPDLWMPVNPYIGEGKDLSTRNNLAFSLFGNVTGRLSDDMSKVRETEAVDMVRLYPNPIENVLTVHFSGKVEGEALIRITDMTGRLIHRETFIDGETPLIDTSKWPRGVYPVRVKNGTKEYVSKVVRLK